MQISVIIPALNEEGCLDRTLDSLKKLSRSTQVIVADSGSTDRTVAISLSHGAEVVVAENSKSRAETCNAGAQKAHGDVLLFLDADTTLPLTALDEIEASLRDQRVVGGAFEFALDGADSRCGWWSS